MSVAPVKLGVHPVELGIPIVPVELGVLVVVLLQVQEVAAALLQVPLPVPPEWEKHYRW
jgi:hypothetical protein